MQNVLRAGPEPDFALYLQGRPPPPVAWESRWLRWPDWWLPADPGEVREALADLWQRAASERVEVACSGGRGRTGTALACLAILDGVAAKDAVRYVREHYDPRAVEQLTTLSSSTPLRRPTGTSLVMPRIVRVVRRR